MTPCRTGIVDLPHTRRIEAPRWPTAKADHRGHRRAAAGRHAARERRVGAAACGARMQEVLVAKERAAARTVARQSAARDGHDSLRRKPAAQESDHRDASAHSLPLGARASGPAASALGGRASFERAAGAPTENGGDSRDRAKILGTAARSPMRWCRARPPARPPPNCLFLFGLLKPAHPINPVRAGRPSQRVPLSCQNYSGAVTRPELAI
jgi:hypothetical protein